MPKPKRSTRRSLRRNNRGQFIIVTALSIVLVMATFSSYLAYASVSRMSLAKSDFRKVVAEVSLNFRRALAVSLANVTDDLNYISGISRYGNYTDLDEAPDNRSREGGYQFISEWQKTILSRYAGFGLSLSVSQPLFECEWSGNPGYSSASSNVSLDLIAQNFYGWKSETLAELRATILNLNFNETDGTTVAFYFKAQMENDAPVTGLSAATASVLFQHIESNEFTLSKSYNLTYLGSGYYHVKFSMYSTSIPEGLDTIKDYANNSLTPEDFQDGYNSTMFCERIDLVLAEYNDRHFMEAYGNLTECKSWLIVSEDTTYILSWIDLVRSQLAPMIRVVLQDSRGIIVSAAYTPVSVSTEDDEGPLTRFVNCAPNPTGGVTSVTLTALIDDLSTGISDITIAEYFVDVPGADGEGTAMMPTDGAFDSPSEEVTAEINISAWTEGTHTLYVHGQDSSGYWGDLAAFVLNVTQPLVIYVQDIDMILHVWRFWWWRLYQAEAMVTIHDIYGCPVEGATVYGHWTGPPGYVQGITDATGKVSFLSQNAWGRKTFTFTVDNVVKDGCVYNPDLNVETSDSISV